MSSNVIFLSSRSRHHGSVQIVSYHRSTDLCFLDIDWNIPIARKHGHAHLEWRTLDSVLYTRSELAKLHWCFQHPSNNKLPNLLRQASPKEVDQERKETLEKTSRSCDICKQTDPTQVRFKVTLSTEKNPFFGEELLIDTMSLDEDAVLHVVDTAPRFSGATFLDKSTEYSRSVEGVWLAFLETWYTQYTGFPNRWRTDTGSIFTSSHWKQMTEDCGTILIISGEQAQNSLGIVKKLHALLRRIYLKVKKSFPHASRHVLLKLAVKSMNDTTGDNGLVPTFLFFGIIPRFAIFSHDMPN